MGVCVCVCVCQCLPPLAESGHRCKRKSCAVPTLHPCTCLGNVGYQYLIALNQSGRPEMAQHDLTMRTEGVTGLALTLCAHLT